MLDIKIINEHLISVNGCEPLTSFDSSSRYIFRYGKQVIKLERYFGSDDKIIQCRKEMNLLARVEERDRKFFIPVSDYGEAIVENRYYCYCLQPFIKIEQKGSKDNDLLFSEFFNIMSKYSIGDLFSDNFGIVKGVGPAIWDYGYS